MFRFEHTYFLWALVILPVLVGFFVIAWRLRIKALERFGGAEVVRRMAPDLSRLAAALHEHGDTSDQMESRIAFAEKRTPNFKGWLNPEDRYNMPRLE